MPCLEIETMSGSLSQSIGQMTVYDHGSDQEDTLEEMSVSEEDIIMAKKGHCSAGAQRPILKRTESASACGSSRSLHKGVSFDSVHVRSYSMTVGDHPDCSYGCPVQLDWDYEEHLDTTLEDYETTRGPRRKLRELVLSYYRRKALLERSGVSKEEQQEVARHMKCIKRQRSTTKMFLPASKVEELFASASRKIKRRTANRGVIQSPTAA